MIIRIITTVRYGVMSSATTDPPAAAPNALVNLSIYGIISLIYLSMDYKFPDYFWVNVLLYGIFVFGINFGLIYLLMTKQCNATPDLGVAIGGSALTFVLLFVPMFYLLERMYVWLRPFGNTFGYLVIKLWGVVGFMDKILRQPVQGDDNVARRMNKYINYVRSDPWGFFSMLTTNTSAEPDILQAEKAFEELRGKLTGDAVNVNNIDDNRKEFVKYVRIKESVGKFIFYLLTLNLMTDMTAVFVMENDNNCKVNAQTIKASNEAHNQKHGGRRTPKPDAVVYKTTE